MQFFLRLNGLIPPICVSQLIQNCPKIPGELNGIDINDGVGSMILYAEYLVL